MCFALTGLWLGMGVQAQDLEGDRSVRELSADRPDATESPRTVDRGMMQLESSVFSYGYNSSGGVRTTSLTVAESNIKYGLLDNLDLQLVLVPYTRETTEVNGAETSVDGFGDVVFRAKYNVWGNDTGSTAFGLLPFVKVPTGTDLSNDKVEGGVVTPFSWDVAERWGVGGQLSFETLYDEADDRMEFGLGHTAVVGYSVTDKVGVYVEYAGFVSEEPYEAYFSNGVTYLLNDRLQLDLASLVGLNDASTDFQILSGVTWKF